MSTVQEIRTATLGSAPKFVTRKHMINGVEVIFKQPDIKTRIEIDRRAEGKNGKIDNELKAIWTLIYCAIDQDGNRVYQDTDLDGMMTCPTEAWVDSCGLEALYASLGMTHDNLPKKNLSMIDNDKQFSGLPSDSENSPGK